MGYQCHVCMTEFAPQPEKLCCSQHCQQIFDEFIDFQESRDCARQSDWDLHCQEVNLEHDERQHVAHVKAFNEAQHNDHVWTYFSAVELPF